jgi:hypothetical protein
MKISTILDKIDENQLFVPAFQREYVWKREDAKLLIDSLIKQYPTGTMLTWETAKPPELKGPHRYDERMGAVKLLLDGQQRVTTLYMLIRGTIPPYYATRDITTDTRELFVNLESAELSYYQKSKMENAPLWRSITDVFQRKVRAKDVVRDLEARGECVPRERDDLIDDNVNAIQSILERDFPEQTIPIKASVREAIDIFYKVNASGVALTDAELALAQISGYWPQARDRFKAKLASLEQEGFVLKLDFIVYVLLGCLYHIGSDMRRLHGEENKDPLQAAWQSLESQVLDYVLNLLRTHAFVDHSKEINSPYALVPMIVYCFDKNGTPLTDAKLRKMVKWFYYSQVRSRYASQLPQKLDRDLRTVAESAQPFDDLLQAIAEEERALKIMPFEFEGSAIQHPLFSMTRWYLKSRNAVCLTTGVSLRKPMGKKYQLELDHIFPYSLLKKAGYGHGNRVKYALAQEFTNRAILTQVANRTKSNTSAADYLSDARERFPHALELQCIPEDEDLWKIENYDQFLRVRRQTLADRLNGFLDSITATEAVSVPVTLLDLINEGESDELEFKSTLRWDLERGTVSKALEQAVLKSIAAFANAHGGTLLIGVEDDGTIVGLEHDYLSHDGWNRDKFELHLRHVLNEHFGTAVVMSKLEIEFHEVDGKDVCAIDVLPVHEPLILTLRDRNGQTVEKLYVRVGNMSQELALSEVGAYLAERP